MWKLLLSFSDVTFFEHHKQVTLKVSGCIDFTGSKTEYVSVCVWLNNTFKLCGNIHPIDTTSC